ncbi:uncharacterized protein A4U43_C05F24140 [Asparagus officinalis]|uniref:Clp R domain-containing protein n=1 Tax=Asparagus officinalis TaxID=4686 RepID=A0A5P1EYE1_ASPOF|nr:protein SMAX1-LIKE 4 [Asparagus officinalis]ONK69549.1 uncharacterized protein A4U43_C05F24140 [Asparagus officinalis]
MRTGACSIQQALTTEAASILKLSLNLARRRGHAQVTPLHVAATLLTSSSSSSNLLRRACLKSHPHHLTSHPLQCRALELCFNVALNRLPTTPPPSSGSLIQAQPSLSNALIAALKRAQAHQRRGCIEQQQQFHQQQQQPILAIKVELEQLIISILDDPSVSRVMREAGFSSTTVKSNIEDDGCSVFSSSSPFFFDSSRDIITSASLLHTHFLKPSNDQNPCPLFTIKEDIKVVIDVLLRKQGKSNTVVIGDSVSIAEGLMSELMRRVDRGEIPDELKSSHFIKLQLSYVHLRLMSRREVDLKVSDLRRKLTSLASGKVIVFVGDLRWALDEETRDGFRPVQYLVEEIGKLVSEMKEVSRVWLMATASYQTYMRCLMRHPSLEAQWALQAVVVPSGGLKLSLQAPSGLDSRVTKLSQFPFQMLEKKPLYSKEEEEEEKLHCCSECTSNFEKEASVFTGSAQLPYWLQPHKPENHHKDNLIELRRKWNRLCRNLHHLQQSSNRILPSHPSSHPWWSSLLTDNKNKSNSTLFPKSTPEISKASPIFTPQFKNRDSERPWQSDVKTTLALGNPVFSDTATSTDQRAKANNIELSRLLQENIPWQSEIIPSIVETLAGCQSKNGAWVLIKGTDRIGKRRLARVVTESFCGSTDKLICINSRISADGVDELIEAIAKDSKCVVLIEDIDQANEGFIQMISQCIKTGILKNPFGGTVELSHTVFILATSSSANLNSTDESHDGVLKMRLSVEEVSSSDHKRKSSESDSSFNENKKKLKLNAAEFELDLNICAEDSDLTHEIDEGDEVKLPNGLLESIGTPITMDEIASGGAHLIEEGIIERLRSASDGRLIADQTAVEGLRGAMGWFLESEFERWVKEIFELSLVTVRIGGKARLRVEGKEGNVGHCGFLGSVLPKRIHVD